MSKPFNLFLFSKYSLTTQIVIINFSTAILALFFLLIFNFVLLSSNENLENQKRIINSQLNEITNYLSKNAIKRILTFDDSCSSVSEEQNREEARIGCKENDLLDKNYEDKPPQLDQTYTQQYIYSNFLNSELTLKVFADDWTKFADTNDFYVGKEEIVIMDINSETSENDKESINFYQTYKNIYFHIYNVIQKYFDEQKLKKLKNDNITIMETIKRKKSTSYIFKDQDKKFKAVFASPILKDEKVYGVVLIIAPLIYDNNDSANQSILLTNFFLFFISIMFFLSLLFSKSIVAPIKLLSQITQLERDKSSDNIIDIAYPKRKDEIGTLSHDIKNMSDDLKKRINEIESFTSDVSHELKNPLSSLKSSSELLIQNKITEDSKNLLIKNMAKDIERMNILISDISNYTLTQVEIDEEIFEKFDVIVFVEDFIKSLPHNNIKIDFKNNNAPAYIVANKNKLAQVFYNIIHNSFSYSPSKSKILINTIIQDENIIFHIVDQGIGVPLDFKEKIFDRFYTDRLKDKDKHTGLGLSISRKIIESFKGSINLIENHYEIYQGACFEIKLPLKG
mgnify:CR=1 FL=1